MTDRILERTLVGVVVPIVLVAVGVVPLLVRAGDLPDLIATHWSMGGTPDGSLSRPVFGAVVLAGTLLAAVAMAVMARRPDPGPFEVAPGLALCASFGAVWAGVSITTVQANVGAANWSSADAVAGPEVAVVLAEALVAGVVAFLLGRRLEPTAGEPAAGADGEALPSVGLGGGERAQWVGRGHSTWAWPMALGCGGGASVSVLLAATTGDLAWWWVAAGLGVVVASSICFTSVRVTADRRGLRAELGALGWPVVRFPLDRIRAAHVEPDARPGSGVAGATGAACA